MAFRLLADPLAQYFTNTGEVNSGGSLTFSESGTSVPKATYSDPELLTPNSNPVELDSAGRPDTDVWGSGSYRVVLKDADGATLKTMDDIESVIDFATDIVSYIDNNAIENFKGVKVTIADSVGLVNTEAANLTDESLRIANVADNHMVMVNESGDEWGISVDSAGALRILPITGTGELILNPTQQTGNDTVLGEARYRINVIDSAATSYAMEGGRDSSASIVFSAATAVTVTFAQDGGADPFYTGDWGLLIQSGAGQVSIAGSGSAVIEIPADKVATSYGENAVVGWLKTAANTYRIFGDLEDAP